MISTFYPAGHPIHQQKFMPMVTAVIVGIHILALGAFYFFSWQGVLCWFVMHQLTGIGITMSYHRQLTHKSFESPQWVKYLFAFLGTLTLEGGPISWVATHRLHHARSDHEEDFHSPRHGFVWSHVIWNFYTHEDLQKEETFKRYAQDLYKDPGMVFLENYFVLINLAVVALITGIGYWVGGPKMALSFLFWGGFFRIVTTWHITWLVNSATHVWGYQTYESGDTSRNNVFVAFLAHGEGWHNNHHADQRAARNGHAWYEIDITYYTIKTLELLGLAYNVVPVSSKLKLKDKSEPVRLPNPRPALSS